MKSFLAKVQNVIYQSVLNYVQESDRQGQAYFSLNIIQRSYNFSIEV
jgi:hypothetical protein